jgi:hypothetical protein
VTGYWWFRPSHVALFFVLPLVVLAYLLPNSFYAQFRAYNTIDDQRFFLAVLAVVAFALAGWIGETTRPLSHLLPLPRLPEGSYRKLVSVLAFVSLSATALFLAPIVAHPDLVLNVLKGVPLAADTARAARGQVPGITSWENIFSVVLVLILVKPALTGRRRTETEWGLILVIVSLSALKAVVVGERLALVELIVPLMMLFCAQRRRWSLLWAMAPIIGVGGLYVFFVGTESLRSWADAYSSQYDSVWDFGLLRMFGYYMTAINNGAWVYQQQNSIFFPFVTGDWFWRLPIPGLAEQLAAMTGVSTDIDVLLAALNPEFNNASGIFGPLIDYGPVLGEFVWLILGYVSGSLYRQFMDRRWLGVILFPTWYVGVLELPRIFYWGTSHYFPPLVVSLIIVLSFLAFAPHRPRLRAVSIHHLREN